MGGANNTITPRLPAKVKQFPYNSTPPIYVFQIQTDGSEAVTLPLPFDVPLSDLAAIPQMQPYPLNAQFDLTPFTLTPSQGRRYKIPAGLYRITFGGVYALSEASNVTDQVWASIRAQIRLTSTVTLSGVFDVGVGIPLRVGLANGDPETFGWATVARIDEPIEVSFSLESGIMLDAAAAPVDVAGPALGVFISGPLLLEMIDA